MIFCLQTIHQIVINVSHMLKYCYYVCVQGAVPSKGKSTCRMKRGQMGAIYSALALTPDVVVTLVEACEYIPVSYH